MEHDLRIDFSFRAAVADRLTRLADLRGGYLSLADLGALDMGDGSLLRVTDAGGGGIWNPQDQVATLSIVTSVDGPYADRELEGGFLKYSYQSGPVGGKNVKLRRAMELDLPVIRFHKVAPNAYVPIYPVYVVADDPAAREFTLTLEPGLRVLSSDAPASEIEKKYAERVVRQRVHQPAFRAQVLAAYQSQCAVCVLKKAPLLDAAHIIGDREDRGDAVVPNGMSLCKIHHAAYDENLLGISPDYAVVINAGLLDERDGPMLLHGLQEMHGRTIFVPPRKRDRPDPDRLQTRFEQFLAS